MITYKSPPDYPTREELGDKNSIYTSNCTTESDQLVKKTASQELWDWIDSEDFTRCPICNKPFQYPGLDIATCETHGDQEPRLTKLEALCRTPLRLGATKRKAIKLSELTEEQARTALFILKGGK